MNTFQDAAAEFVYTRTYSRWRDDDRRRETWAETVERYIKFISQERGDKIPSKVITKVREYMLKLEVLPSMRAVWSAGEAARRENMCMYNCTAMKINRIEAFSEMLYILMCGAGVGFSVTAQDVGCLPVVPTYTDQSAGTYQIPDDRAGWADSVKLLLQALYAGRNLDMDYSKLRPKGARLKNMGGRSSGPAPLLTLHNFIRDVMNRAQGRRLTTLECHDLCCQIADVVIVGGVRRSSLISLSDLSDENMQHAKDYPFPARRNQANNSAIYSVKPAAVDFLREWARLAGSGTGERGIFNLEAIRNNAPERRKKEPLALTNPCAEISLRDCQCCNLSEVVVRPDDDLDNLLDKVETATWMGVIQSTFTHFPYLNERWKQNCEEERLLGVSLTGQMDNPYILTPDALKAMKKKAIKVAQRASEIMGINMPAAITCGKPSGTVSQLVSCASGMHPQYAPYYIRRYRISSTDPLLAMIRAQGVRVTPENHQRKSDWTKAAAGDRAACSIYQDGQEWSPDKVTSWVVAFPCRAPSGSITRDQVTAIDQLEWYKKIRTYWCEHNQSCTVYVKDHEWFEVGNWVYHNWDLVNGVSFLPYDGGRYEQAPYEEVTAAEYHEMVKKMPKIDYSQLSKHELEDGTTGSQAFACVAGACAV